MEIGRAVHEPKRLYEPSNAIQAAEILAERGEHRQSDLPSRALARFEIKIGADAPDESATYRVCSGPCPDT